MEQVSALFYRFYDIYEHNLTSCLNAYSRLIMQIIKGVGLVRHMWQRLILACKIISFQNDNAIFVNRQEMTFFGAQKGLWGGRRGSVFLIF